MLRAPMRLLFASVLAACGFGNAVEQDGSYVIVPSTPVNDSTLYPLESLVIIEEDVDLGETRVYAFTGDLQRADLGFPDLRRIAVRHGGFQMAFDPPREPVEREDVTGRAPPLRARAGDREVELLRLDDTGLIVSGASRYLASVSSSDYVVAAYAAVLDQAPERFAIERRGIDVALELADPELRATREDDRLGVEFATQADYVVMELGQILTAAGSGGRSLNALVRTTLAPDGNYALGRPLLTDVTGQGCWSRERTLTARLTQVSRRYQQRREGDWAAIHLRSDAIEIGADAWREFVEDPTPPGYCAEFE